MREIRMSGSVGRGLRPPYPIRTETAPGLGYRSERARELGDRTETARQLGGRYVVTGR